MDAAHEGDVLKTYHYLRLALVLLVGLLGAGVLWQILHTNPHCLQTSISAYYYTPTRAVFVASLGAIGASLIVYRGNSPTEDVLLNLTGIAAVVVAFVPTARDHTCRAVNVPTAAELSAAVTNNGWALLIIGLAALGVAFVVTPTSFRVRSRSPMTRVSLLLTCVSALGFTLAFLIDRNGFRDNAHAFAAILLFAGIVLVVLNNALSYNDLVAQRSGARKYANRYWIVAAIMVTTLAGLVTAHFVDLGWQTWLFWLEAAVVAEFGGFWVIQTEELWGVVNRSDKRRAATGRPKPAEAEDTRRCAADLATRSGRHDDPVVHPDRQLLAVAGAFVAVAYWLGTRHPRSPAGGPGP